MSGHSVANWKNTLPSHLRQAAEKDRYVREFLQKSAFLATHFPRVAPLDYWEKCLPERIILVRDKDIRDELPHMGHVRLIERVWKDDLDSILLFNRELARYTYVPYQVFFDDFPREELLREVRAFVVDLDRVSPKGVQMFVQKVLPTLQVQPNFLVNSGHGLHVVWMLKTPVQAYRWRKPYLKAIQEELQNLIDGKTFPWDVDRRPLIQAYRLPGFPTKLQGAELDAEAFLVRPSFAMVEELEEWFNLRPKRPAMVKSFLPPEEHRRRHYERRLEKVTYLPNARGLFDWLLRRVWKEGTQEGKRYLTMCALVVAAWKSRVPLNRVREELEMLVDAWNELTEHGRYRHRVKPKEIDKALSLYNSKATLVRREVLAEWTGLSIPKRKRNGLSREAHIKKMNLIRSLHKDERAKKAREMKRQGFPVSQIASRLGVSKRTVFRYLQG